MKKAIALITLLTAFPCLFHATAAGPPTKTAEDKFIHLSNIAMELDANTSMEYTTVYRSKGASPSEVKRLIDEAEAKAGKDKEKYDSRVKKIEEKQSKKEKLSDKDEEETIKYEDTKFSDDAAKTLKTLGYIDTVNRVFQDENNTVVLEGKISKIKFFFLTGPDGLVNKAKVYMIWYVKNRYGEIMDSIRTKDLSKDFIGSGKPVFVLYGSSSDDAEKQQKQKTKMVSDAVDTSLIDILNQSTFKKYMKSEPLPLYDGALLHISRPSAVVTDKGDAIVASVIVKREDRGHGSGFAISQDGYIITNYHVIATKDPSKTEKIKVLTSSGDELEATVVRYSKASDIALLKVDKKFDKAFIISQEKQFKNLDDVYTIGAPKSIELGQSYTNGLISNERKSNNTELLQLSMSINFGNSGGPLFDAQGRLHGVIVSKLVGESTEGIGFAIPAYRIQKYINISY